MAQFYSANRRVATRERVTVLCDQRDAFGHGLVRHRGKVMFIPGLLPGEQAEVRLTEDKRQYSRGEVVRRLNDALDRVAPRSPHYGVCGGCQQQHISQALQQRTKAAALAQLLAREQPGAVPDLAQIGSIADGYRRRTRLGLVYRPKSRQLSMGYRQAKSSDLVDIHVCPILRPALERLIAPLRACLQGLRAVAQLGYVELAAADNGPLIVLCHLQPLVEEDHRRLLDFAAAQQVSVWLAPDSERLECLSGEPPYYRVAALTLRFSPRDFIQIDDEVNRKMVAQALDWLAPAPGERVLDLFCSMGNFTLPLARLSGQVTGVEAVAALVANGQYNAQSNSLSNVTFFHENLEQEVMHQPWAVGGFDKLLLDPARAGAAGVMPLLAAWAPQRIVYVSCNPATLARDSKILLAAGYTLVPGDAGYVSA